MVAMETNLKAMDRSEKVVIVIQLVGYVRALNGNDTWMNFNQLLIELTQVTTGPRLFFRMP